MMTVRVYAEMQNLSDKNGLKRVAFFSITYEAYEELFVPCTNQ